MYLGIDFLIGPDLSPWIIEVNVGLPGGATEYDRAYRARFGRPSGVYDEIERISKEVYGRPFGAYVNALPFIAGLKEMKIRLDGRGPLPRRFHPALRLEDKWVQALILRGAFPFPETMPLDQDRWSEALDLLERKGPLVSKLRSGRGGRGFRTIASEGDLIAALKDEDRRLLQERIESRLGRYALSIRAVAFGGRWVCAYANLAERDFSNHGTIALVREGPDLGLEKEAFGTRRFDERSWEADIWYGAGGPGYLHHNLYEDEAADAALCLPPPLFASIREMSVRIERTYEALDLPTLPQAWFEGDRSC